ncbi:MAG: AMP-binding protein, partial [bacterium]|nr:AMP-binding protein [bacterium]
GEYWRNYLAGCDERAEIPRLKTNAAVGTFEKKQHIITLDEEKTIRLSQLAAVNKATLNTTFQTLWGILLAKYTGKNDALFGAVVSGRPSELEGVESMVGLFINTVPVRIRLPLNEKITFNRLLQDIQKDGVESEQHHYYPLAEIQAQTEAKQNLIDHIIIFENYPLAEQLDGIAEKDREEEKLNLKISNLETFEQTDYDLNIVVAPAARLLIQLDYNAAQYAEDTVRSIADSFNRVLESVLETEGQLDVAGIAIMSTAEKNRLLYEFNTTPAEHIARDTIHELFEQQAARQPENQAIHFKGEHLTYARLDEKITALANRLLQKGVGPGSIVGVIVQPSLEMAIAIFGILKAGGAYIPIDPAYPEERIAYMIKDSGTTLLLSTRDIIETAAQAGFDCEFIDLTEENLYTGKAQ